MRNKSSSRYLDSSSDEDDDIEHCTANSKKSGKNCICLTECRYDVVRFVAKYLDWRVCEKLDHIKVLEFIY
jgi:hypothetical protein